MIVERVASSASPPAPSTRDDTMPGMRKHCRPPRRRMRNANERVFRPVMPTRAVLSGVAVAVLVGAALPALAMHPMLTEDTGTQGKGRFELELGFERVREGDATSFEFGPQLSWGALDNVDLIVRPAWLDLRGNADSARDLGDTALDVKWRFLEANPWSYGLRAGLDLPTGSEDKGLGSGKTGYHGVLIATWAVDALSVSANVGVLHVGNLPLQRRNLGLATVGIVWEAREGLRLAAEVDTATNPDPGRSSWPTVTRVGIVWSLDKHWDVDVGYQAPINRPAPDAAILAGATLRW